MDNVDVFAMLFRQYRPLTKTGFFLNRGFLLNRFFLKKWFFRDPNILHTQASKTSFLTSLLFQNVLSCVQKMLGDDFDTFSGYSVPPPGSRPLLGKKGPKNRRVLPPYWDFTPPIGMDFVDRLFQVSRALEKTRFLVIFTGFFVENTSFLPPLLDFYPPYWDGFR